MDAVGGNTGLVPSIKAFGWEENEESAKVADAFEEVEDDEDDMDGVGWGEGGWRNWRFGWWRWSCLKEKNREITGYTMTGTSRGPMVSWIAVFSVVALTTLGESVQDCDTKRVTIAGLSLKTTSVVSTVLTVEGVVNALLSVMFGALADSTQHRTRLFQITMFVLASAVGMTVVVLGFTGEIWALLAFAGLLIVASVTYDLMAILHAAYVPELAHTEKMRTRVTAKMYGLLNLFQLVFVGMSVGATLAFGLSDDEIGSAQLGASMAVVMWAFWALPGMFLIDERPKAPDQVVRAGFLGIPRVVSMVRLCVTEYRQIGLYLVGYSLYINGASSVIALAQSYMLTELGISGLKVQILVGLALLFTVPGALLLNWIARRVGSLQRANLLVIVYWIVIVALIPVVLVGEPDPDAVGTGGSTNPCAAEEGEAVPEALRPNGLASIMLYAEAVAWGLGIGAIYPTNVALFAEIVPGGSEAAFTGMKTLAGKALSWAPPLVYTVINETTGNVRLAISAAILPFLLVGGVFSFFFDMDVARAEVEHTLRLRHGHAHREQRSKDGAAL